MRCKSADRSAADLFMVWQVQLWNSLLKWIKFHKCFSDPCVPWGTCIDASCYLLHRSKKMRVMTFDPYTVTALQGSGMQIQPSCVWIRGFKALSRFLLASTQNYLQKTNLCGPDFVAFRYTSKDHSLSIKVWVVTHWWAIETCQGSWPNFCLPMGEKGSLEVLLIACLSSTAEMIISSYYCWGEVWRMTMLFFWVLTSCTLVGRYQRFGETQTLSPSAFLVSTHEPTRCQSSEEQHSHSQRRENLKSHMGIKYVYHFRYSTCLIVTYTPGDDVSTWCLSINIIVHTW
jgi:hypothetical protein